MPPRPKLQEKRSCKLDRKLREKLKSKMLHLLTRVEVDLLKAKHLVNKGIEETGLEIKH